MTRKILAILLTLALAASLVGCGGEETTVTGMVVSVEGTVIQLMETSGDMGNRGQDGQRPEGMENFQGFGNFNPEDFTMPEGETRPQRGDGERPQMPEDFTMPEGMTMPEQGEWPEDMTLPEGMTMPQKGERPSFGGNGGNRGEGFGNWGSDAETKELDLANAHISIEIEGGKESGSMDDIHPGTMVTVTLSAKGQATYVLISSRSGFGGFGGFGNFGGFGGFGGNGENAG